MPGVIDAPPFRSMKTPLELLTMAVPPLSLRPFFTPPVVALRCMLRSFSLLETPIPAHTPKDSSLFRASSTDVSPLDLTLSRRIFLSQTRLFFDGIRHFSKPPLQSLFSILFRPGFPSG